MEDLTPVERFDERSDEVEQEATHVEELVVEEEEEEELPASDSPEDAEMIDADEVLSVVVDDGQTDASSEAVSSSVQPVEDANKVEDVSGDFPAEKESTEDA